MQAPADGSAQTPPPSPQRTLFRRRQRLAHNREFQAVYNARVRKARAGIIVFGLPNGLAYARLGLSVGRPVGNAVVRNRVKRLLREAFRLEQHSAVGDQGIPPGFDFVVSVRPHRLLGLAMYRRTLVELSQQVAAEWARRERRADARAAD